MITVINQVIESYYVITNYEILTKVNLEKNSVNSSL